MTISNFLVKTFGQLINNLQTEFRTLKAWFYDDFLVLNPKRCHIITLGKAWFYDDFLVLNPKRCHIITLGNGSNLCNFSCDDIIIKNSLSEKILGFFIDNNLDFSDHISNISKSANQKLNALFRVSASMN